MNPKELHDAAMAECDKADAAKRVGDTTAMAKHLREAYRLERHARAISTPDTWWHTVLTQSANEIAKQIALLPTEAAS